MYETKKEWLKPIRRHLAQQMHEYIIKNGNEEIYYYWTMLGVPDEPTEEDFEYFETKENFDELTKIFDKCCIQINQES